MAYTTIDKPTDYFNTKLYTGNGSTQSISGIGFQPDWTWIKRRNGATFHLLTDSVRGVTKQLYSNDVTAENTNSSHITSFDSNGFSLGSAGDVNSSSNTFVSWNWLASNTTASNTDGSITSTVSANTTAGFSIVSYTGNGTAGATIGHGLGVAPKMIITKSRNNTYNWTSYHASLGNTGRIRLNLTDASQTGQTNWNSTTPTSSVFSLGTNADVNGSGNNVIAYCFAEKKGFSKFGSYTGNGNNDGTFVYTGFKPALIILKHSNSTGNNWRIFDNKRDNINPIQKALYPSTSDSENNQIRMDFVSNGFKLRSLGSPVNDGEYIYMSFAESPFVTSTGIPTTAR